MMYGGLLILENELMVDWVHDWSHCRSPSRAKRRRARGFPQHDRYIQVPRREVIQSGNTLIMHPDVARELRRTIAAGGIA